MSYAIAVVMGLFVAGVIGFFFGMAMTAARFKDL